MVKYCSTVTVITIYLIPLYQINTFCLSSCIQISRNWLKKILFLLMVIAAPIRAAELAGIIMCNIAETSRHMQNLNTLMLVTWDWAQLWLNRLNFASRTLNQTEINDFTTEQEHLAVVLLSLLWKNGGITWKEGISLPLYQILEIWYLTTYFLWMASPWPQVSLWGILIRFLTRIYASVVGVS